ncbi:MAG: hypothetical protein Q9N02_05420, partial [Ghiorsea sp.]|nr:hypothetical protein [Ghiorsea sp.]
VMINPEDRQAWESIQPNIKKALAFEEWPKLYQALFYSYTLQENWDEACTLGIFLKQQRWGNEKNIIAYNKACQGEKADDFMINR